MAGEVALTELLLGMGLRQFSMQPSQLPLVKRRLFELSSKASARLAARVLRSHDPVQIRQMVERGGSRRKVDSRTRTG